MSPYQSMTSLLYFALIAGIRCTPRVWSRDTDGPPRNLDRRPDDVVQVHHLVEESPEETFIADFNTSLSNALSRWPSRVQRVRRFHLTPFPARPQVTVLFPLPKLESLFYLDSQTGILTTFSRVDREQLCRRDDDDDDVAAAEDYRPETCVETCSILFGVHVIPDDVIFLVEVVIDDVNDNDPTFPEAVFHARLSETATEGTQIALPAARDGDSGLNGTLSYELFPPEARQEFDLINISEFIYLNLKSSAFLDRETANTKSLIVVAIDAGQPRRTGTLAVDIEVVDSNDNRPKFDSRKYTFHVVESRPVGTVIGSVLATDDDEGDNARISYSIEMPGSRVFTAASLGPFAINATSGDVILSNAVDYERRTRYRLNVRAADGGSPSLSDYTEVVIVVIDANDNAPEIIFELNDSTSRRNGTEVVIAVSEGVPVGTAIAHFSVYDVDSGDGGTIAQCRVLDEGGTSDVSESSPLPLLVERYFANSFALVAGTDLDRELKDFYSVVVVCSDGGGGSTELGDRSLIGQTHVEVHVTDVNDNAPRFANFDGTVFVRLEENNYPDVTVTRILATDADLGDNATISYSIFAAGVEGRRDPSGGTVNCTDVLRMNRDTGDVQAVVAFDRERFDRIRCVVVAIDGGRPMLSASGLLIVDVLDVNDETPRFQRNLYEFEVAENQPAGTEVGRVVAVDADLPPFNRVQYFVDDQSASMTSLALPFTVDAARGTLLTTRRFDRETDVSVFRFTIFARDASVSLTKDDENTGLHSLSGTTGSATVIVKVTDINDNRPAILFPSTSRVGTEAEMYEMFVHLEPLVGDSAGSDNVLGIGHVIAYDDDSGPNAHLTYRLILTDPVHVHRSPFWINETSGEILASRRDLLGIHSSAATTLRYRLRVRVADNGFPRLMAETEFHVVVNRTGDVIDRPSWRQYVTGNTFNFAIIVISAAVVVLAFVMCCSPIGWRRPTKYALEVARHGSIIYRPKTDDVPPPTAASAVTSSKTAPEMMSSQNVASGNVDIDSDCNASFVMNSFSGDQQCNCSTRPTSPKDNASACRCVSVCCDCCSCQPSVAEYPTNGQETELNMSRMSHRCLTPSPLNRLELNTKVGKGAAKTFSSLTDGYRPSTMYDECSLTCRPLAKTTAVNESHLHCTDCSVAEMQQQMALPPEMNPVHWTYRPADLFFRRYLLTAPDAGARYFHQLPQDHVLSASNDERLLASPPHLIKSHPLNFERFLSKTRDSSVNDDGHYNAESSPELATSPLLRARDRVESCPSCSGSLSRKRATQKAIIRPEVETTESARRRLYDTAEVYS